MKAENQSKELFRGAFILTVAALLTKVLSAVYRIPFQNIVGDVGFYIYQQVYPFYGLAVVLASTGFPVVISKIYAELAEVSLIEAKRFLMNAFLTLQLLGFASFLTLYLGAEKIASWMNDPQLSILIKVVSIVFLTFPAISILRGYFQGTGKMLPTAASQISEQAIRVGTILFLAFLFTKQGYSLYFVGGGAMFGSVTGSIVAALVLLLFLKLGRNGKQVRLTDFLNHSIYKPSGKMIYNLIFQGLAICLSGMLLIFMQMADSLSLFSLLVSNGFDEEAAKTAKGIYDRGQPLIQLGTVVATSVSLTLVPLITAERMKQRTSFLYDKIRLAMQINIVIGVAATTGLLAIIEPTNKMLFENGDGSDVLGVLTLVILLNSLIVTMTAILQGMGTLLFPAAAILLSLPLKYILNLWLIPQFGTMGAAISTVTTLLVITFILSVKIKIFVPQKLTTSTFNVTVVGAAIAMLLVLKAYLSLTEQSILIDGRAGAALQSLSAVLIGGFVYLIIIIRKSIFRIDELAMFPLGSKLILLMPKHDRRQRNGKEN